MKIVVCVKQIHHLYSRTGMDPVSNFISKEDSVHIVNPLDEIAVEEAIRVKESLGRGEVILVTLGDIIAEKSLRRCLAMGVERLIQLNDPSFHCLDKWGISFVLAKAMKTLQPDMILCGKEALDDPGGQVGAYIAEELGLPYVSCVAKLELIQGERKARIQRSLSRGNREVVECLLPEIFGVEKGLNEPRYPTTRAQLLALDKKTECWGRQSLGLQMDDLAPMTEVIETYPPKPRPKGISAPDSSLGGFERTLVLLSGSGAEKVGSIMEGTGEALAGEMLGFLTENKIIEAGEGPNSGKE